MAELNVDLNKINDFVNRWINQGKERQEAQTFWRELLRDVLNISEDIIKFEEPVKIENTKFIDGLIEREKNGILIEQKSHYLESLDGAFQQAKNYNDNLEYNRRARYIITCNFQKFIIYDTKERDYAKNPVEIKLEDLPKEYYLLDFIVDAEISDQRKRRELSIKASQIVGKLYDALRTQYTDKDSPKTLRDINILCVRLVFLLYIDNTEFFGRRSVFSQWLKNTNYKKWHRELKALFNVLNTDYDLRDNDADLNHFPYVNGGLFADNIDLPNFTQDIKTTLNDELFNLQWDNISPSIFGTIFEATINPVDTKKKHSLRHEDGVHYTEPTNIVKVIKPLFIADFDDELAAAKSRTDLINLQNKIANIKIFDPACGSGNFLTESYIQLRKLENKIIAALKNFGVESTAKVSVSQFYGIEINDFAVKVAKTALWISKLQMHNDTKTPFPLQDSPNIVCANAITTDWKKIISPDDCTYIISNPPFSGYSNQTAQQKADLLAATNLNYKKFDYVAAWYFKAADFIQDTQIRCAFVSTNSICQGEQVAPIWRNLKVHIDFAYRTFKWSSEAFDQAQVHVVIIGFSNAPNPKPKVIYNDLDDGVIVENINGYLMNAKNVFIDNRAKPLCKVPAMSQGNRPTDNGNLIIEAKDYEDFIKREPRATKYIRPFMGSEEFINGKDRYCLWLVNCPANDLRNMKLVYNRVNAVREFRLSSRRAGTRKAADTPYLFTEIRQPETDYIVVPSVSSEKRKYVPIGFIDKNVIVSNLAFAIPNADVYLFGVLTSIVHMAWMRTVCGRLEISYRYSSTIVYNNFPFVNVTCKQKAVIERTAQKILDVRAEAFAKNELARQQNPKIEKLTLADLYDRNTMPKELHKAHIANDKAVMAAYGFKINMTEEAIVSELFELYEAMTK